MKKNKQICPKAELLPPSKKNPNSSMLSAWVQLKLSKEVFYLKIKKIWLVPRFPYSSLHSHPPHSAEVMQAPQTAWTLFVGVVLNFALKSRNSVRKAKNKPRFLQMHKSGVN